MGVLVVRLVEEGTYLVPKSQDWIWDLPATFTVDTGKYFVGIKAAVDRTTL
jgi:hypothetical protein